MDLVDSKADHSDRCGENKLTTRIDGREQTNRTEDAVESKLTARIDAVESKMTARLIAVENKLTAIESRLTDRIGPQFKTIWPGI